MMVHENQLSATVALLTFSSARDQENLGNCFLLTLCLFYTLIWQSLVRLIFKKILHLTARKELKINKPVNN